MNTTGSAESGSGRVQAGQGGCPSVHPTQGHRCDLEAGHDGPHWTVVEYQLEWERAASIEPRAEKHEDRRIPRYLRFRPGGYQDNALTAVVTEVPREQLEQDLLAEQDRVLELVSEVSRLRGEVTRVTARDKGQP